MLALNLDAIRGILPDVTFLLLVDVDEAVKRSAGARDRIEREGDGFSTIVDNGYRQLAGLFPRFELGLFELGIGFREAAIRHLSQSRELDPFGPAVPYLQALDA